MSELATINPFDSYEGLSTYGEAVQPVEQRNDALATISGGYRDPNSGYPVASRDGTIYLSDPEGRAVNLANILKENKGKFLTITPCSDNPNEFFQENFAKRSKTRLEAWGDATGITEIKITKTEKKGNFENVVSSERIFHPAGTPEFERLRAECKVEISFFFYLAEWKGIETKIIFLDGLAPYRLRTTSQETRSGFLNQMRMVAGFSHGKVRGVPFELRLVNKTKTDEHGTRRDNVPIFKITVKPPGGLELSPETFNHVLTSGIKQSESLYLPKPTVITIDHAASEVEVDVYDPLDTEKRHVLESGVDVGFRRRKWYGMIKGTILEDGEKLEQFLDGADLSDTIKYADENTFSEFLHAASDFIKEQGQAEIEAQAAKDLQDPDKYRSDITSKHINTLNSLVTGCDIKKTEALSFIGWLADETLTVKRDITSETVDKAQARLLDCQEAKMNVCEAYRAWCASDEAALEILS